jgi:hypothetical protein
MHEDIIHLIEELNYWVAQGGDPEHPIEELKSTGESHAKVLDLKDKLRKVNAHFEWQDNKYVQITPSGKTP